MDSCVVSRFMSSCPSPTILSVAIDIAQSALQSEASHAVAQMSVRFATGIDGLAEAVRERQDLPRRSLRGPLRHTNAHFELAHLLTSGFGTKRSATLNAMGAIAGPSDTRNFGDGAVREGDL